MWKTEYHTWIKISDDAWVNTRNVVAVERKPASQFDEDSEGIWVHLGGAKLEGTITLEEWHERLKTEATP